MGFSLFFVMLERSEASLDSAEDPHLHLHAGASVIVIRMTILLGD
jgi:hypothetical protein